MNINDLKKYTKGLSILIVEDEKDARERLVSIFKNLFKDVDSAENGEEGFSRFSGEEEKYDIILTDINMPKKDGVELIKEIRRLNASIPIIVLSAYNESDRLIEIINAGADSFLQKPLNIDVAVDILYRISVRACDAKTISGYLRQLEEQNIELLNLKRTIKRQDSVIKIKVANENLNTAKQNQTKLSEDGFSKKIQEDHSDYYRNILQEDVSELVDLTSEIESYVLLTFQESIVNEEYVDKMSGSFQKFGSILYRYPIFGDLSESLFELSKAILEKKSTFLAKQDFVVPFLENLIFVLHKYVDDVWKKPAKNPHFYDASMINDIKTFMNIVSGESGATGREVEDILEFF